MGMPSYYNYSKTAGNDKADDFVGLKANSLGEVLEFQDARRPGANKVEFLAFISSFSQAFTSNWNETEALGRMDNIATFKNTTRSISVTWEVPAPTAEIAEDNLNRINALISMLYPDYTDQGSTDGAPHYIMSKPPLVRIKYANLISTGQSSSKGLLGYITSLSWNPVLEMGSFHSAGNIFPRTISISIEFKVLHEQIPGKAGAPTGFYGDGSGLKLNDKTPHESGQTAGLPGGGWPFGGITQKEG